MIQQNRTQPMMIQQEPNSANDDSIVASSKSNMPNFETSTNEDSAESSATNDDSARTQLSSASDDSAEFSATNDDSTAQLR